MLNKILKLMTVIFLNLWLCNIALSSGGSESLEKMIKKTA